MKKVILFAALAAAVFVSCQKKVEDVMGIKMSLRAEIGGATKVDYTPDGNVLKTSWSATETISVLTLDGSGKLVAVDNFTSTGVAGREQAEFTGTFTGGADPVKVIAVYPALKNNGAGKYDTEQYTDFTGAGRSYLYNGEVGSEYIQSKNYSLKQTSNNDASHFVNYCILSGSVNISGIKTNELVTTLEHQMTVLKVNVTMPAATKGKTLDRLVIKAYNSAGDFLSYNMGRGSSWEYINMADNPIYARGGAANDETVIYAAFEVPDSGQVVFYIANPQWTSRVAGEKWGFQVFYMDGTEKSTSEVFMTFPKNVDFERGHVYRMNVSFE